MTDTTTPDPTADRARFDQAAALVTAWRERLAHAEDAQHAAEQTAPADVLDHPDQVEQIVADRAAARETVRVTAEVLGRAEDAQREAGRALLAQAAQAYHAQAEDAQAELTAWETKVNRCLDQLEALTEGDGEWFKYRPDRRGYNHARPLARAVMTARCNARFCELAAEMPNLGEVLDAHARRDQDAWPILREALTPALYDNAGTIGRGSLPPELKPGGVYPLA